jgi:hypothetical protein
MKNNLNLYYLISILIMFLSLVLPLNDSLATLWGLHMFVNFGWTILLIIEHFKK